jgi:hypothetical protein
VPTCCTRPGCGAGRRWRRRGARLTARRPRTAREPAGEAGRPIRGNRSLGRGAERILSREDHIADCALDAALGLYRLLPVLGYRRWPGSLDLVFLSGQIDRMLAPRFPAPWSVLEIPGGFRVQDANRRPLAYFYGSEDPNARRQADVLTLDDARRMAEKFAELGSA